jgi:hypothetical protein
MVHDRLGPLILAVVMMAGLGPNAVRADAINFTGNVPNDFANANTVIIPVNPSPQSLGEWPTSVTDNGTWVTGWNIKNIYLSDDPKTGTLYVGINNWANANGQIAPFGQANGDPSGTATPYDPAHLGYGTPSSDKSIAMVFAPTNPANPTVPGTPVVIAGIPADKTKNGPGIDGYAVSSIDNSRASGGPAYMFGQILPNNQGNLAFDPTPAHPQLEFTIKNFNQLIDPSNGFWIEGFAGSAEDRYVSTTSLNWTEIPPTIAAQNIPNTPTPEPSTWLMWSLASGMVLWGLRRRRNRA